MEQGGYRIEYNYPREVSSITWKLDKRTWDIARVRVRHVHGSGLDVGEGVGGSGTAFFSAFSRNTAYECGACASSAEAVRSLSMSSFIRWSDRDRPNDSSGPTRPWC